MDQSAALRRLAAMFLPLVVVGAAAGCGGAGTATPSSEPPSAAPTAAPSQAGPFAFASWTERQGFGGSSGLNQVRALTGWLTEHRFEATAILLDTEPGGHDDVVALIKWLDLHEPTACWVAFHAGMRASLLKIEDGYATITADVAAGHTAPEAPVAALFAEVQAAYAMAAPPNCP